MKVSYEHKTLFVKSSSPLKLTRAEEAATSLSFSESDLVEASEQGKGAEGSAMNHEWIELEQRRLTLFHSYTNFFRS